MEMVCELWDLLGLNPYTNIETQRHTHTKTCTSTRQQSGPQDNDRIARPRDDEDGLVPDAQLFDGAHVLTHHGVPLSHHRVVPDAPNHTQSVSAHIGRV